MRHLLGRQKQQVRYRLHTAPVPTGLCRVMTFSAAFWQRPLVPRANEQAADTAAVINLARAVAVVWLLLLLR